MNTHKTNWWLDAVLFAGFLTTFFLDITGVELHQWIGIGLGFLLLVHLTRHMDWVGTVVTRFFGKCTACARVNLVIDGLLMGGFGMIIFTGLIISTWLNLTFINYTGWWAVHVTSAVVTLFALLVKLYLHRKWIVNVAETHVFGRRQKREPAVVPGLAAARVNRREFLKMGAVLGAGALVGVSQIHNVLETITASQAVDVAVPASLDVPVDQNVSLGVSSATSVPMTASTTVPTIISTTTPTAVNSAASQSSASSCSVRCRRGCSFPGHCRKYTDSNDNGKCDLGECL